MGGRPPDVVGGGRGLRAVCKLEGLDAFPFDKLGCRVELGSWSYSGLYVRTLPLDGGFSVGGSETAGESFAEFTLAGVDCKSHIYPPYPCCPSEDWPVLWYFLNFRRSWQPYVRAFLSAQVVLNALGFSCFWLPAQCGERLGLGITALLASVASDLVVAQKLPTSSEWTWIAKFSLMSISFSAAALFESVIVLYFYYAVHDDLWPLSFGLVRRCRRRERAPPEGKAPHNNSQGSPLPLASADADPPVMARAASFSGGAQYARDADDFTSRRERENNEYWQAVASWIDEFSRWVLPSAYAITLAVMLVGADLSST